MAILYVLAVFYVVFSLSSSSFIFCAVFSLLLHQQLAAAPACTTAIVEIHQLRETVIRFAAPAAASVAAAVSSVVSASAPAPYVAAASAAP